MKQDFFTSNHCKSRKICDACRNIDNKSFREDLKKIFSGIDKVNFACPFGKVWKVENANTSPIEKGIEFNGIFIRENKNLFTHIEGFSSAYDSSEKKIEEAKANGVKCTRCKINSIYRKLAHSIQKSILSTKNIDLLESLPDNIFFVDENGKMNKNEMMEKIK